MSFPQPEFATSEPEPLMTVSVAAPVAQALVSASPPYSDSFTRADSTNLGADWTAVTGGFDIFSNVAYGQTAGNIASVNTLTADNVAVQADVALTAGQSAGVMARYGGTGPSNFYLGFLSNSGSGITASIYRNVNGSYTLLSSKTVNTGTGTGTLRFELSGSSLKLFFNGTVVTSANDTTFTSGKVGIFTTANVSVDNFTVASITPLPQTLTFTDNFDTAVNQQLNSTAWTNQAGLFNVQTGVASASAPGVLSVATVNGVSAANVAVSASVTVTTPGQYAGLVARSSGPGQSNFYLATLYNNGAGVQAYIFRILGGAYVLIGQGVAPTSSGLLRFEVSGSSLKLFLNNTLLTSGNDAFLTTGSVGIYGYGGSTVDAFNASSIVTTPPVLPFTDTFNTATNAQLNSAAWTNQAGLFNVNGGVATGSATAVSIASLNGVSGANVGVEANVSVATSGQLGGLIARYSGPGDSNYYLAALYNTGSTIQAYIFRNLNGAYTPLASVVVPGNASSGLLRFEVSGSSLKLFLNGNQLTSANDTALTTGSVGMHSIGGATFDNFNAAILPPAPTTSLPFSDTFTTPANQLSTVWTNQVGAFNVSGGNATGPGANSLATLNGVSAANVGVEANVSVAPGQFGGLVARYGGTGDSNYYLAILINTGSGTQAIIYRILNGAYTLLDARGVGSASGLLRFEVSGSSLKVFLNGTIVAHANDTALTTGGSVGMRSTGGATFDNFIATAITVTPQILPVTDAFTSATNSQLNSAAWTNQAGTTGIFDVSGGKATGLGTLSIASLNGLSAANVAVEANVTASTSGQLGGLIARYGGTGDSNYYLATLVSGGAGTIAAIYRNLGGSYVALAHAVAPTNSGLLRFELSGTSLKLFLNGNLLTSANDTRLTTGSVGMRSNGAATFDNFNATAITVTPQTLIFSDLFTTAVNQQLSSIAWTNQAGGVFTVSGGLATAPAGVSLATVNGVSVANTQVQASVAATTVGLSAGLVTRYGGPGDANYYLGELYNTGSGMVARILLNLNGSSYVLASAVVTTNTGLLSFSAIGSTLTLSLNGNVLATATNSNLSSGSVGMRGTAGATFDNFVAS